MIPLMQADNFLRSSGYVGDFQINSLVLTAMCAFPCGWRWRKIRKNKVKHVTLDIDRVHKTISVTLFLNRWRFLLTSHVKISNALRSMYREYLPDYAFDFKFDIYGRKQRQPQAPDAINGTPAPAGSGA